MAGMSTRDIEKECGKSNKTVAYWIAKYDLWDLSKYKKTKNYRFDKIDTKDKAYALGFILADSAIDRGNSIKISVSMKDKAVCEYISTILNCRVFYDCTYDKKSGRFPRARLNKKIEDILKFTGGAKKIERHYPRVRNDLEKYLLLGLFDADGCITWGRRKDKNRIWQKVSFTSQFNILLGVQKFLYSNLEITTSIKPKRGNNCYVLEFANRSDVLKFCEFIYSDKESIILHRKYLKYEALRLELEENGENSINCQSRAELAEQEGVETIGDMATYLNNRDSIQGCMKKYS